MLNVAGSAIAHARTQTARELIDHLLHRSLVGHAAGNALGHQLLHVLRVGLEVAVLRAVLHGLQRAHAAIALELTAVVDDGVAGALLGASHQRAYHHARSAGCQRLHHVARIAQSAIGDEGHAGALQGAEHIVDGAQLGHAHTGHHTRGADAARAYAHLHGVGTVLHQQAGSLAGGNVAHHNVNILKRGLGLAQLLHHALRVAMGRVDDNGVGTGTHQRLHAVERVNGDTHAGSHAQAALVVLAGHGLVLCLGDVLIGDEAHQAASLVHHGQLLNLVLLQNLGGIRQVGLLVSGHQVLLRHHVLHGAVQPALEAQVTVGDNAHQVLLVVHHGNAANVILRHDFQRLGHRAAQRDGHGVVDHAVLSTLHNGHLAGLVLNRHVLVDDANAALAGNGNGHLALGDGVHGSRHKGHVQVNVARKAGFQLYRLRQHLRIGGNQQDVIESKAVHHNLVCNK